jgi:hypothetical protein
LFCAYYVVWLQQQPAARQAVLAYVVTVAGQLITGVRMCRLAWLSAAGAALWSCAYWLVWLQQQQPCCCVCLMRCIAGRW